MNLRVLTVLAWGGALAAWTAGAAQAQWVTFQNQTAQRINAAAGISTADPKEKDYAWGDVDNDGDIDLVCVRKEPFSVAGGFPNVLFMNVNGVLTDMTAQYASASDVPGDQGFLTATNDRDVLLVDLDNDGWLDIVTATTVSDGLSKVIGHPRVYRNLGEINGVWQGFRHENFRIPQLLSVQGNVANPRFCSVGVGDVTGDGYADLYFGDYDSGQTGPSENPANDMDNKLLINMGAANPGVFVDESTARMGSMFNYGGTVGTRNFLYTTFGAASIIVDMNGDGINDVVKQTALTPPQHVAVMRNNPSNVGFFDHYKIVYANQSPYFVSAGDLNNDNRMDLIMTDDSQDKYLLNTGNDANGSPNFTTHNFTYQGASDDGFGSQSIAVDLDNDGWKDVVIADVDVDGFGCGRRTHIYRNLGNGPNVTLREETTGTGCGGTSNPASCLVASIPANMLVGTYHTAIFDVNGDGFNDIVLGRCNSMEVWINIPNVSINYTIVGGVPVYVTPDEAYNLEVDVAPVNGALQPGSVTLFTRINDGSWNSAPMTFVSGNRYAGPLPAVACHDTISFYIRGQLVGGGTFYSPSDAPGTVHKTRAAESLDVSLESFEISNGALTIVNDPALIDGAWEHCVPIGTISGANVCQPGFDAEPAPNEWCWVTKNGLPGGTAAAGDVDGGPTHLISPAIDLTGTDAIISFHYWFFGTPPNDTYTVAVSNNGGANWTTVLVISTTTTEWTPISFQVSDYFPGEALGSSVRVRCSVIDGGTNTNVEGGLDAFTVSIFECEAACTCPANMNGDNRRDGADIRGFIDCLLGGTGPCGCADMNNDGLDLDDVPLFVEEILLSADCAS